MPGTTAGGWPYVLPSDHPLEYPAFSQQLATLVDTGFRTTWTAASGWADAGGLYAGLYATKLGPLIVVEGTVKRTSALVASANTAYLLGTLPVGYRPAHQVQFVTNFQTNSATAGVLGKLWILGTGDINLVPATGGTINTDQSAIVAATFRGA